jgi:biotin carboxylase
MRDLVTYEVLTNNYGLTHDRALDLIENGGVYAETRVEALQRARDEINECDIQGKTPTQWINDNRLSHAFNRHKVGCHVYYINARDFI